MTQTLLPFGQPPRSIPAERRGAIFTKPWVVEFLLDLAGFLPETNLVDALAVEPAAGEGVFLVAMARRLIGSCRRQGRPFIDCARSLIAYEIDEASADVAKLAVIEALVGSDVSEKDAGELAANWVRTGDYLFEAPRHPKADFVIGNPPYIRLEEIPAEVVRLYRIAYPTMRGRADLYVAFFEAALRGLKPCGTCAYICADRWMLNQYGAELRQLITSGYNVRTIVEMHNADAFDEDVSAYPAITIIRREPQREVVVASAGASLSSMNPRELASTLDSAREDGSDKSVPTSLISEVVEGWFAGSDPWPCGSPRRLALLRRLEEKFPTLENDNRTKVGIGVATGCDRVFITRDKDLVEPSRLLPLAMAADTFTGYLEWSGHYLIDPWDADGLVTLSSFPRLKAYLETHRDTLVRRHTAKKNPGGWYRTIDRVTHSLSSRPKLYIPDIKNVFNPVYDPGGTYPHHNLYFLASDTWDLEVLGGILLSAVGQFFIEAYGVRMRGGYLRFQAQYLRRIRVPLLSKIRDSQAHQLVDAFRRRDRALATSVALELYELDPRDFG
jgi:adenine-specific DNA-methyltransferase